MKIHHFYLGLFFCITSSNILAGKIAFPDIFSASPVKRFQPSKNTRFDLIERELRNMISRQGDPKINNIFCASGFAFPDGGLLTTVIWTNKRQLYWWNGSIQEPNIERPLTLWLSPYSDLKNAVEDGTILGGPTTVNRSQAKAAVEDCEQYGEKFLVVPFAPFIHINGQEPDFDVEDLEYIKE